MRTARHRRAVDPKMILDELKYIQIAWAEGDTKTGIPTLEGKKFTNVRDVERALNRFEKPDLGYNKVGILIVLKDGTELKHFRYDHGKRDPSFIEQFDWYVRKRVSITGSSKQSDERLAREIVAVAEDLVSGRTATDMGLIRSFLKIRPGKRVTMKFTNDRSGNTLYAHVWFDDDVAQDDFGNDVRDSGEWQIIISPEENWMTRKEWARREFRYADPKMRNDVARMAADWAESQLKRLLRRA